MTTISPLLTVAIVSLVFPAAWKSHKHLAVAQARLQKGMQPAI
jgi:hypothetical protein